MNLIAYLFLAVIAVPFAISGYYGAKDLYTRYQEWKKETK
jgi:hypothetical protein